MLHGTKQPQKWLFVTGCYNSGTNLLARMLGAHANISTMPGEGIRFTRYLARPETFGWNRMWCECLDKMMPEPGDGRETARKIMRDLSPFYSAKSDVFLEKSIPNLPRMEWLDQNFDNAYFIGLIRNPYAVCEGIRRRAKPGPPVNRRLGPTYPIELPAKQWRVSNALLYENARRVSRFKLVRYEDLVRNPVAQLQGLLEFIGEMIPEMAFENQQFSINCKSERIRNLNEASIARLSQQDVETINRVLGSAISDYGYDVLPLGG